MEKKFIYVFFNYEDIGLRLSVKAKSLILWLVMHSEYNKGCIKLTPDDRKEIMIYLKCNNSFLSRLLKELRDLEIINGKSNIYYNPYLFWYGDLDVREKFI
jgi:hypothetical protein